MKENVSFAIAVLNAAERIEPSSCVYLFKGTAFLLGNATDGAAFYYAKALQMDNDIFDAHHQRAIYRTMHNDWKGAFDDYNEMSRIDPGSLITLRARGETRLAQGDFAGAIKDFSTFLKKDSLNAETLMLRANARKSSSDLKGTLLNLTSSSYLLPITY
jgi:tetratricopeptide (TPR) repeat protein